MSKKSKKSSARTKRDGHVRHPFDPAVEARAREIAADYGFVIQPHPDFDGYMARGLELPNVFADGKDVEQCVRSIREALKLATAVMLEMGDTPPAPAGENKRQEQINIRVTSEEKLLLEEASRAKGFRSISDFVRSASLASSR